jgi:hypothetical protein
MTGLGKGHTPPELRAAPPSEVQLHVSVTARESRRSHTKNANRYGCEHARLSLARTNTRIVLEQRALFNIIYIIIRHSAFSDHCICSMKTATRSRHRLQVLRRHLFASTPPRTLLANATAKCVLFGSSFSTYCANCQFGVVVKLPGLASGRLFLFLAKFLFWPNCGYRSLGSEEAAQMRVAANSRSSRLLVLLVFSAHVFPMLQ